MELGILQKMLMQWQDLGNDHTVCSAVLGGTIPSEAQLRAAVKALQRKHIVLRAALTLDGDGSIRLRETATSNQLSGAVSISTQDWQKEMSDMANTVQFPRPRSEGQHTPTWRVILARGREGSQAALILVLNHCFFDGTARNRLLLALLSNLRPDHPDRQDDVDVPMVDGAVLQQKHTLSWFGFVLYSLRFLWSELSAVSTDWRYPLEAAPGIEDAQTPPRTDLIHFSLGAPETEALVARCRQEQTTVHGILTAAACRALVALPSAESPPKAASFLIGHLTSYWPLLAEHIPPGAVTGLNFGLTILRSGVREGQGVWELAREVRGELAKVRPMAPLQILILRELQRASMVLRRWLSAAFWRREAPYRALKRGVAQLMVSNLGRVSLEGDFGGTAVDAVHFCTPRHHFGGGLGFWHVQTVRGRVHFTLSYYRQVWAPGTAQAYVAGFRRTLLAAAADPR